MGTDFASNLKANLEAKGDLRRRGRRILAIINGPDSPHKARLLARMEDHARAHLGLAAAHTVPTDMPGTDWSKITIDWSKIDWAKIIDGLLKLLLAILPVLLGEQEK